MAPGATFFDTVQQLEGTPVLDPLMLFSAELLVFLVPLTLLGLWYRDPDRRQDWLYVFAVAVTGTAVSYLMGLFYSHPPPYVTTEMAAWTGENAFPSQHTAVMVATGFGYLWQRSKRVSGVMLGSALLTGFARIYIQEHWPFDILGAFLAGAIGLGLVYLLEDPLEPVVDRAVSLYEELEERANMIRP